MLAYYAYGIGGSPVLEKRAGKFINWFTGLGGRRGASKPPSLYRRATGYVKNHPVITAMTAAGLAGGAYLGNKAYNNQLPPVRVLPRYYIQDSVDAWKDYPFLENSGFNTQDAIQKAFTQQGAMNANQSGK